MEYFDPGSSSENPDQVPEFLQSSWFLEKEGTAES